MRAGASKRWQRRNRPWRPTGDGVVVATLQGGTLHLTGATAAVWRLLDAPATSAELAEALRRAGRLDGLDAVDPLELLRRHDLLVEVQ